MEKNGIGLDYDKAFNLCEKVLSPMYKKLPPFNGTTLFPDANVPEGIIPGSDVHAKYLFHGVSLDSRKQADEVYRVMTKVYEKIGDLSRLARLNRKEVLDLLEPHFGIGVRYPKNPSSDLVGILMENAQRLQEEENGNPLQLLKPGDIWGTLKNIARYRDYGIPKAALLMKNYIKFGMWPFKETEAPIKVDRHVTRITLGNGIVNAESRLRVIRKGDKLPRILSTAINQLIRLKHLTEEQYKKGVRVLRASNIVLPLTRLYWQICIDKGLSGIDLDDAFWLRGARSCRKNDAVYCDTCCPIACETRYPSDNNAIWFFVDIDKRRHQDNLFTQLRKEKD